MILNFDDPYNLTHEFSDLLESFNYYDELGHSGNLGFYKIDQDHQLQTKALTYTEKLARPLWQKKRKYILEQAGYQCQDCNAIRKNPGWTPLLVHFWDRTLAIPC